jgi:hypothetical protein
VGRGEEENVAIMSHDSATASVCPVPEGPVVRRSGAAFAGNSSPETMGPYCDSISGFDFPILLLSKRLREEKDFVWSPAAAAAASTSGPGRDGTVHRAKMMRTSAIFAQLQKQVMDAVRWRRERDAREKQLSAEIAERHPVCFPEDEPAQPQEEEPKGVSTEEALRVASFEEQMMQVAQDMKERQAAERGLPAPLTNSVLAEAYTQLPAGPGAAIKACIECWHEKKLDAKDVLKTVQSFSGASAALQKLCAALPEKLEPELATPEQLRDIFGLSQAKTDASACSH